MCVIVKKVWNLWNLLIPLMILGLLFYFYQQRDSDPRNQSESIGNYEQNSSKNIGASEQSLINLEGNSVRERITPPEGFIRMEMEQDSFGAYLQNLPLKPHGARVLYFDGREKTKDVYAAVVDMEIGERDLQQCADAVIRLRAEYLYQQEMYDKIRFSFVSGFSADYSTWMQGNRINVNGSQVTWVKQAEYNKDYASFRKYLDMVFAYAGTASLAKELNPILVAEMRIGDVFIVGGSPGHCVIIVDMAENRSTGEKLFLLAQSYMPAQDIQILKNPRNSSISPWYDLDFGETLITPEWQFDQEYLMRF
ncbi:DUF4846 domain-containing protein [Dehalobacterium formicoaceticum]